MKADNPLDALSSGETICIRSSAVAVIALLLCVGGLRASDSLLSPDEPNPRFLRVEFTQESSATTADDVVLIETSISQQVSDDSDARQNAEVNESKNTEGEQDSAGDSAQTIAPGEKLIVVVGAAGAEEFAETFDSSGDAWAELAERQGWQMCRIAEDESNKTCKEQLRIALKTSGEQRLWLVLIGHGTFANNIAKFNLAGPDVSATELAEWLDELNCPQVIINCASASAPFMTKLAANNRIVITATQSGSEYNYTRFGEFLAQTINDPGVDLDHDQEVSLLEAFLAASKLTQRFYQDASRLATEHALLNDNGDRVGTSGDFYRGVRPVKRSEQGIIDGDAAARIIVLSSSGNPGFSTQLNQERVAVEAKISALRSRKALLDETDYYNQLEQHLLELAEIYDRAEADQQADGEEDAAKSTPEEAESETDIQNRADPYALAEQPLGEDAQDERPAVQDRKESKESKENADRR